MSESAMIPDIYRSDHLFLLVGTNPLPNYIAAMLLLNPEGQLYLVHSKDTRPAAERLAHYWLEVKGAKPPRYVRVEEADSANIRQCLDSELQEIKGGLVGLNYTGGTKIMSVHACRTLLDFQEARRAPVALSYLDARTNRMYIEYGSDASFRSDPVLHEVRLTLEQVISLHVMELNPNIERTVILPDLAALLATTHASTEASRAWRAWCENELRKETRTKRPDRWDSENYLRKVQLRLPEDKSLAVLVESVRRALQIENDTFSLDLASQTAGLRKVKHLCEWLDGKWLEYHILNILQDKTLLSRCKLNDVGMGLESKNEMEHPTYETDIAVMQGYRLNLISVTTEDEKGMCKLKLFEAERRAQDMGGDAAYVGFVCLYDHPEILERQIGRSWDDANRVRVFGRPDLKRLADRLSEWFIN